MTSTSTTDTSGRRWPLYFLAPLSAIGGLVASTAFAPLGWWLSAYFAVAILVWCIHQAGRLRPALLLGWIFGLTFMATSLVWQTSLLIASYLALTLLSSLWYPIVAALIHLTRRVPAAPFWAAGAWVVTEFAYSRFPFDGFAWMRLGYSQYAGPLAGWYPLIGAAGVSYLVALLGHLLAWLVVYPSRHTIVWLTAAWLVLKLVGIGGLFVPAPSADTTVNVGWVQGGAPGGGVYGLGPPRTITTNQNLETSRLMMRIEAGELPRPDFIVWPENSTDLDPRLDAPTRELVDTAVARAGVPILVGSIFEDPQRQERQTVSVWWTDQGPGSLYAKRNLVPFGEWIPFRDFFLPLIPELKYVGAQSVPGTDPGALIAPIDTPLTVGVALCYEVIYPDTLYQAVDAGAQAMVVASSNAMYQGTAQIDQQFAITRVRAAEMRREILVVTTSGVTGKIDPYGFVTWTAPNGAAASGVEEMSVTRDTRTPVMVAGWVVEPLISVITLVAAGVGLYLSLRGGRRAAGSSLIPQNDGTMAQAPPTGAIVD